MKRLEKVCSVWNNLDKVYDKEKQTKMNSKSYSRIDFLKKITQYSGNVEDDLTKFKSMFANEIRDYNEEQLKKYEDLISDVEEILEIITLCTPSSDSKSAIFQIDDNLTIEEIRKLMRNFFEERENAIGKMNLFDEMNDVNSENSLTTNADNDFDKNYDVEIIRNDLDFDKNNIEIFRKDYNIVYTGNTSTVDELFELGKISNYYEIVNGKITAIHTDCCSKDYVYINNKAAFYNFIYKFSSLKSPSDFYKAIFLVLISSYANEQRNNGNGFNFPYVFLKRDMAKETEHSFIYRNVVFRKKNAKVLSAEGVRFKDLSNREYTNYKAIIYLNIKNSGTAYRVCIIG